MRADALFLGGVFTLEQLFIAVFGLTAIWLALGKDDNLRKWSPVCGLIGQPFWMYFALQNGGWGIFILTIAYTLVYLRGFIIQWGYDTHIKRFLHDNFRGF